MNNLKEEDNKVDKVKEYFESIFKYLDNQKYERELAIKLKEMEDLESKINKDFKDIKKKGKI